MYPVECSTASPLAALNCVVLRFQPPMFGSVFGVTMLWIGDISRRRSAWSICSSHSSARLFSVSSTVVFGPSLASPIPRTRYVVLRLSDGRITATVSPSV